MAHSIRQRNTRYLIFLFVCFYFIYISLKLAIFEFWRLVGERMELHSLPDTIEEAKEYLANFNETSSKETAEGLVLREAIDKELQRRYSFIPSAAVRPLTGALLYLIGGSEFIEKLGLPPPNEFALLALRLVSWTRRALMWILLPPRMVPKILCKTLWQQHYSTRNNNDIVFDKVGQHPSRTKWNTKTEAENVTTQL